MKSFPRIHAACLLIAALLVLVLPTQGVLAKQDSDAYSLQVVDKDRTANIDFILDAPLDTDSGPPAVVNRLDVSGLDQGSLSSQNGDMLHADLGLVGNGFLKALLGDINVSVRVRKFGGGDLTVEQLHADLSGRWAASDATASKGSATAKAEIVTIGASRYSHVEKGENEAKAFVSMYSIPLMHDCFVEIQFQFTASDSNTDAHAGDQAHALIDQVMKSVSIKAP